MITKIFRSKSDIVNLAKTRMQTLDEFLPLIQYLIEPRETELTELEKKAAILLLKKFNTINNWKSNEIFTEMKQLMQEYMLKGMPVFYVLFTGNKHGLPLPEMLEILGRQEVINRLHELGK